MNTMTEKITKRKVKITRMTTVLEAKLKKSDDHDYKAIISCKNEL